MSKVFDGFTSLQGGMNGGTISNLIDINQYAIGVNVKCRDGKIETRSPFIEITLESDDATAITNIQTGKFQGHITYENNGVTYIAFAFSGRVYLLDPLTSTIYDMTAVTGLMNQYVHRMHFCQADRYLIVQDGINLPIIIEGTSSRVSVPGDNEVPIGTVMAYCQGRLFVKTAARSFVAGNIFTPVQPGNVLVFTETQYLAGGGAFYPPADLGDIVSMTWSQSYGTATGEGPLIVLCERGTASYNVSVPRLNWQDMSIMRLEPAGNGCASEFCVVKLNEDLLYMSWDGLQDFALTNEEVKSTHRVTNLNKEVKPFLDEETSWMLPYTSAAKFDDRILYTAVGERVWAKDSGGSPVEDYRFNGLISLDFAPTNGISSLGETRRPAYDGIWTGVHPMAVATGIFNFVERCFVFGKDDDGINHLYELTKTAGNDNGAIPIECQLYTRSMPFIDFNGENPRPVPYKLKNLIDAQIWINSFRYSVDFDLWSCADHTVHFHKLSTIAATAPLVDTVAPFESGMPQPRPRADFPKFTQEESEELFQRNATAGYEMQFLLTWNGTASIYRFDISAESVDNRNVPIEYGNNTQMITGVPPDYFSYDMEEAS